MSRDWEATFRNWTKPSSDTECDKQDNATRMIRDAINDYQPLAHLNIKIIPQGSYRNNTNVKAESDVDICVCCMEPFFFTYEFADYGTTESAVTVGVQPTFADFKNNVETALVKKFTRAGVTRGKKAFDIHANTYRVDADVVAAFAHRRYQKSNRNLFTNSMAYPYTEPEGTQFYGDDSPLAIVNWPEQHYRNGVTKNTATNNRFKWAVRALKNLKYEMEGKGNFAQKEAAKLTPSYLCECLMYNVPSFPGDSPREYVRRSII